MKSRDTVPRILNILAPDTGELLASQPAGKAPGTSWTAYQSMMAFTLKAVLL